MTQKFKCLQKIHGPAGIAGSHSTKPKEMLKVLRNTVEILLGTRPPLNRWSDELHDTLSIIINPNTNHARLSKL